MTARLPPNPGGVNRHGSGKGMKLVTKPLTKKRGASKDRTKVIALNRAKFKSATNVPTAEIADWIDPNKPLTEKAKLFVKFWAQGESIVSASVKAGYGDSASYAYKLVHYPQARALYDQEKRLYEEASQMTRKRVIDGHLEAIEMAKLVSEPSSMVAGWREIGKLCGYYEPVRKTIDINVRGMDRLNGMSDAQLLKIIQDGVTGDLLRLESEEEHEEEA